VSRCFPARACARRTTRRTMSITLLWPSFRPANICRNLFQTLFRRYYTTPKDVDSRLSCLAVTCDRETPYDVQAFEYSDQEPPKLLRIVPGLNSGAIQANFLIRVPSPAIADIGRERTQISVQRDFAVHNLLLEALIRRRNAIRGTGVSGAVDPLLSLAQVIARGVKASYRRWIRRRMEV
jgi:hypothetical protein